MQGCKQLEQLVRWWQTPVGEQLLQQELAKLAECLEQLFGYKLVLIAPECFAPLSAASRMGQVVRIDPFSYSAQKLPSSVDCIIIPHLLSYLPDAEQCMKDCWQNLEANGQLIITGYRGFSYLGWSRLWNATLRQQLPVIRHNYLLIKDWLHDSSFKIMKKATFAPISLNSGRLGNDLFANGYMIAARKELVLAKINASANWQKKGKVPARVMASGCRNELPPS